MVSRDRVPRAIARLRRRPELRALSRLARRDGNPAWIVGGAVRDALLGLEVPEIDVAVTRDAEGLAKELEREGFGTAVFVSRDRPGPRVFRVAGKHPLDIAELEGDSIATDLARRDFTVNAVAAALDTGRIEDPFGGLPDLAGRRLRCVRPSNLRSDPLRTLRAARFLATHGLAPDRDTLAASRRAAAGLARVARERVTAEMGKLLGAPDARPASSWAFRAGILPSALGMRLSRSRARRAARALGALDGPSVRALPSDRRRRLRLALLATELALSPRRTREWLRERRATRADADAVPRLQALAESALAVRSRTEAWRWALEGGDLAADALRLLRVLHPKSVRLAARLRRLTRTPPRRVAVTGDDVVRWLGISPGPEVGALLSELRLAAAMGTVCNRREARNWLSGQVRKARHRL
jgi:tRNA nucleotidyltransferase/poly(A) polymerase